MLLASAAVSAPVVVFVARPAPAAWGCLALSGAVRPLGCARPLRAAGMMNLPLR
jgi:hypothetical protein